MAAKDRKKKQPAPKVTRRAGRVTTIKGKPAKSASRVGRINKAFIPDMKKPKGLSPEARWMEVKPEGWNMIDWLRLFTPDESLWEAIYEEAYWAAENEPEALTH